MDTVKNLIRKEEQKVENILNITIAVSLVVFVLSLIIKLLIQKYGY